MSDFFGGDLSKFFLYILNGIIAIFMYVMKTTFLSKKEFNEDHGDLKDRVTKLESAIGNLPNKEALHDLSLELKGLRGDLKVVEGQIEGFDRIGRRMQKQVDIMEDYLRKVDAK